jgi:hypothetical protein
VFAGAQIYEAESRYQLFEGDSVGELTQACGDVGIKLRIAMQEDSPEAAPEAKKEILGFLKEAIG